MKGSVLEFIDVPFKKRAMLKHKPQIYRIHRGSLNNTINNKRSRVKGRGIRVYKFKALWKDLPQEYKARKTYFRKDRGRIHNQILKP
jgi:hypothetical protein